MALSVDLPVPMHGVAQVRLLDVEWILEARPQGIRCLAVAERVRAECWLGLPGRTDTLHVSALPPRFRVEVELETDLVVGPGGAVRGWFDVPLRQRLWLRDKGGSEHDLVVVEDPALRTGWREVDGYYHPWRAAWVPRPGPPLAPELPPSPARLWLRCLARNHGNGVSRPRQVALDLAGQDVGCLRGIAVGPRVTWRLGAEPGVELQRLPRVDSVSTDRSLEREDRARWEEALP